MEKRFEFNINSEDGVTLSFDCDDKKYVVYTNFEHDATGNLVYYAGILNENEEDELLPIESEREFRVIEMVLYDCLSECLLKAGSVDNE